MYDLIIIGTGPAGFCAAIYAQRARLNTLLLEKSFASGGQIINTSEVDNYPGLPGITGMDLAEAMKKHALETGISPVREAVKEVKAEGAVRKVITNKSVYEAKAVLIATGARHSHLGVPGEEELSGMGVSYCATCDGAFYKDQTVAVVGGGNVAVEDAILLARICKKVYVIHRREELRAEKILQEKLFAMENVEMCWNSVVTSIDGEEEVTGVTIRSTKDGGEQSLKVNGVFIAVGILPNSESFAGLAEQDEKGYLKAKEDGKTSVEGIYAAGDVRTKEMRQIITAAADGANAVHSIQKYLLTFPD